MVSLKIGIVEDEPISAAFLQQVAVSLGHSVVLNDSCENRVLAFVAERVSEIDMLFLDINLKGGSEGIWLARELNRLDKNIAIVYTSAYRDRETIDMVSKTKPFSFLSKPFDTTDVEIVISLFIEKMRVDSDREYIVVLKNGYMFDTKNHELKKDGIVIRLTQKERELLNILCKNINKVVMNDTILMVLWGDKIVSESALRDTVYRLRKKIPDLTIENVSSMGYLMNG